MHCGDLQPVLEMVIVETSKHHYMKNREKVNEKLVRSGENQSSNRRLMDTQPKTHKLYLWYSYITFFVGLWYGLMIMIMIIGPDLPLVSVIISTDN